MKREIINLENTWDKLKLKKKRKYRKKQKTKQIKTEQEMPKRKRGRPKLHRDPQDQVIHSSKDNEITKYQLNDTLFYDLMDLLSFLKVYYGIDYENSILKDEQKQEFKVKLNHFFKNYSR